MLRFKLAEEVLSDRINGNMNSVWARLIPPEYLYKKESYRAITRDSIKYRLDISDAVDHFIYFGFADESFERIKSYVSTESIIIDVGANMGRFTLAFAHLASKGWVISFEPDAANFRKLLDHVELNKFMNVNLVNKALGSSSGVSRLFKVNKHNSGMNRFKHAKADEEFEYCEVEIATLDDEVINCHLKKIDIIKIDVEGFEYQVLAGAERSISKFKPILFIELVDANLRDNGYTPEYLVSWIVAKGYEIFRAKDMKRIDEFTQFHNCHYDILCLPQL